MTAGSRREFLQVSAAAMIGARALTDSPSQTSSTKTSGNTFADVKALTFDTFGTVVDYRSSIIAEGEALGRARGLKVDWTKFADAWRGGYSAAMNRVRTGELPWTTLEALNRMLLDKLLADFDVQSLTEADRAHFNRVWQRLAPWPDAVGGLTRLKKKFVIAPLSNGNFALLTNLGKFARLPWDCVLGADLARHYKPDKELYLVAANLLGLTPPEIMMVAAHRYDLNAAHEVGFRTAFVPRPKEGPNGEANPVPDPAWDVVAADFNALATALGA